MIKLKNLAVDDDIAFLRVRGWRDRFVSCDCLFDCPPEEEQKGRRQYGDKIEVSLGLMVTARTLVVMIVMMIMMALTDES